MALKLVAIFALASLTIAIPVEYQGLHAPSTVLKTYTPTVVKSIAPVYKQLEPEAPAHYEFSYAVHDEHTGDIKSQQESRQGDVVHGRYELIEPDGYRRIVEYSSDAHSGFNAAVHREDSGIKIPQPAPQVNKIIAPIAKYVPPVAKVAYVAPKVSYTHGPALKVVAPAKIVPGGYHSSGHESSHVTFNGPSANYHY